MPAMLTNMPAAKEQDTSVQNPQLATVRPPFYPRRIKKPRVSFNKLMQSSYFRIGLTFFLLILLFLTASFIAFQSEQKRKKLKDYEKQIPDAEILVPEIESVTPTSGPILGEGCVVGGCNSELCQDADKEPLASICLYKPEYACYQSATCERQADGKCGWTQTEELKSCLSQY